MGAKITAIPTILTAHPIIAIMSSKTAIMPIIAWGLMAIGAVGTIIGAMPMIMRGAGALTLTTLIMAGGVEIVGIRTQANGRIGVVGIHSFSDPAAFGVSAIIAAMTHI